MVSCEITGEARLPATPKIDTPLAMYCACRLASPFMVCAPVRYVPLAMDWSEVVGVHVVAPFVVTLAVRETEEFPAVPDETYPAVTEGVTDMVLDKVRVLVPVLTEADVPLILAGAVALPEDTDLVACEA